MTGLQMWMLAGILVAAGASLLVWWAAPADPDLAGVLRLLGPVQRSPQAVTATGGGATSADRAGATLLRLAPPHWLRTPVKDLAILGRTATSYYGEKLTVVGITLVAAPVLSAAAAWLLDLPVVVPVGVTIVGVVAVWLVAGQKVKAQAEEARADFTLALSTYVELVALDRRAGGSGTRQAMEAAAAQGASWPFRRISEALTASRLGQVPPWDELHSLGEELAVPALIDLADTMRLAGLEGARVFDTLQAQSAALRHSMLTEERTRANRVSERTVIPTVFMGLIFAAIITIPGIMRMLAG